MKRSVLLRIVVLSVLAFSCSPAQKARVLHVNSLRGQLWPIEQDGAYRGGFSLLSSALKKAKNLSEGQPVYTVAVFNAIHGTPEAHFSEGQAVVELMNASGFDALVVGPREFYFGLKALETLAGKADFPFLAANVRLANGTPVPYLKPYFWDQRAKVGLIGLTPRQLIQQNLEQNVRGLELVDEVQAVSEALAELSRLGAKTIGLFAGGVVWGAPEGSQDAVTAERLLRLEGIDQYWFGSPSPDVPDGMTVLETELGPRVIVIQSGARYTNGFMVADTLIATSPEGSSFRPVSVDSREFSPDQALADLLYSIENATSGTMNATVATATADFFLDPENECSMGNLVTDILREYCGADVFLLNSGKIRSSFQQGPITRKQVYDTLPFGGNVVTARVTGAQLLRILNRSCTFVGAPQAGRGFLQVSGISFAWDPQRAPMNQVLPSSVRVGGKALDPNAVYLLGTEAYIFGGGDGYTDFADMGVARERFYEPSILGILESALQDRSSVAPGTLGRITTP